jgi:hypothetical protein
VKSQTAELLPSVTTTVRPIHMEPPARIIPTLAANVCRWCGLTVASGPHGSIEACVQALQQEVQRLRKLTEELKSKTARTVSGEPWTRRHS